MRAREIWRNAEAAVGAYIRATVLAVAVSALLLPAMALAQAPPPTKTPVAPKVEQLDPDACAHSDTQTTIGKGGEADAQRQVGLVLDRCRRVHVRRPPLPVPVAQVTERPRVREPARSGRHGGRQRHSGRG